MTAAARIRQTIASVTLIHCGDSSYGVTAVAISGAKFHLQHAFTSKVSAEAMAAKIRAKGSVDEAHWDLVGYVDATPAASHLQAKSQADAARFEAAPGMQLAA